MFNFLSQLLIYSFKGVAYMSDLSVYLTAA